MKIIQKTIGILALLFFMVILGWWLIPGLLIIGSINAIIIWGVEGVLGKGYL